MLDTGQRVRKIPHAHGEAEITCMILSQSQQRFLTGATDGMIKIWDVNTGMLRNTFLAAGGLAVDVTQFAVVQNGIIAVGWSRSPTFFRIEDLPNSESNASEWTGGQEHQDDIVCVAYCPPHHIATASLDGEIVLWNMHSERVARRLSSQSRLTTSEAKLRQPPSQVRNTTNK
jgi:WD40 repeat protein